MDIILSTNEICELFDTTRPTLGSWYAAGMPKAGRGKWPLYECFRWYLENVVGQAPEDSEKDPALADIKRQYWSIKTEKERFDLQVKQLKFYPRKDIARKWAERIFVIHKGLYQLVDRLPALFIGKSYDEIKAILQTEIEWLIKVYCENGEYTPTATDKN